MISFYLISLPAYFGHSVPYMRGSELMNIDSQARHDISRKDFLTFDTDNIGIVFFPI